MGTPVSMLIRVIIRSESGEASRNAQDVRTVREMVCSRRRARQGPTPGTGMRSDGGHRPGQSRMGNCSAATRLSERAGVPNKVDGQCTYRNGKYCNYAYLNCFLFKKTNKQKDISGKHVFKLTRPALVIPRKLLNFGPCFFFPPREVT